MSSRVAPYWNRKTETMPREQLTAWQWRKLQQALEHARRSPFWRERLPHHVGSLDEYFARVPLLYKSDLIADQRRRPPYGTLPSVDPRLAIRHHQTSGTGGDPPVRTFDTARDWAWGVDLWCTALHGMGVRPGQKGMVAFGYGLFIGFWGMHYALERMGCLAISSGGFDSTSRVRLLVEQQLEVLGCTPSYARRLMQTARDMGVNLATDANVKIIMAGGEPRSAETTQMIADAFGARVFNAAGTTEFGTICMFECPEQRGGCHIIESGVIDEVLHPQTKQPVRFGERGVRVTTGLGREGIQLFRHWTDDFVIRRPWHECGCGRTWDWYDGGILGRVDEMLKVRGVSVTPLMIEDIMRGFPEVSEFQATVETIRGLDTIVLRVEPGPAAAADTSTLCERIGVETKRVLGIRPQVELADRGRLPRYEVKARRFHDRR